MGRFRDAALCCSSAANECVFACGHVAVILSMSVSAFAAAGGVKFTVDVVKHGDVQIEVLSQGKGPTIVIVPSLGRSVRDYDQVAQYLVADGFRVLRPEPRGVGKSSGCSI
ncbi:hypothetical protein [Paraburkholderia bengalensis]|uniref:alpha/beta fold hydrolase n=1 Tax=Paraburkholderia bengalensis TaxID=2747562 RepID=UPI003014C541